MLRRGIRDWQSILQQRRGYLLGGNLAQRESPELINSRPEQLPIPTTFAASRRAGMAITHSLVTFNALKL